MEEAGEPFTPAIGKIVKELQEQRYAEVKEMFRDKLFPQGDRSFFSSKKQKVEYEMPIIPKFLEVTTTNPFLSQFALDRSNKRFVWKRLSEVFDMNKLNVIRDIDNGRIVDDVIQGELGDCYFLSALSALAQTPNRISNLIPKAVMSPYGVYEVQVYIHGQLVKILLDDYFPFIAPEEEDNEDSEQCKRIQLASARINPTSLSIWPLLLEKAWAKCNQSYEDIASGNSSDAFHFLTPAAIDTYYHNVNTKGLFALIQAALLNKYIAVCDMTDTESSNLDSLAKMGLITNHAYSITETVILKDKHDKEIFLLKISNPWNTNKWVGDWSNSSSKWTEQHKEICRLDQKAQGVSWICFEDYIQYYTTTHICHVNDAYHFVNAKFHAVSDAFHIVTTTLPIDTSGYFIVNLKTKLVYRNLKAKECYDNPYCQINVFRKQSGRYSYIGSDSGKKDRLYVYSNNLVKGVYYVSVTFPKQNDSFSIPEVFEAREMAKISFRVGVYSPLEYLELSLVSNEDKKHLDLFFEEIIHQIARNNVNAHKFVEENENDTKRIVSFEPDNRGYGYIYYENHSEAFLRERIGLTTLRNINIIPRLDLSLSLQRMKMEDEGEIDFEDQSTEELVRVLKEKERLISTIKLFEPTEGVSHLIEVIVAPSSSCMLILQKTDEEGEIAFKSQISFDYVSSSLLTEKKFKPKKQRLKYNNKPIEIFECITEYNTGVLFIYKNKTSEFKLSVSVTFSHLNNLYLSLVSDDLKKRDPDLRESSGKIRRDVKEEVVKLTVSPGETKFFDIRAVDIFKPFSYTSVIDYQFRLSKAMFLDSSESSSEESLFQSTAMSAKELTKSIGFSFNYHS